MYETGREDVETHIAAQLKRFGAKHVQAIELKSELWYVQCDSRDFDAIFKYANSILPKVTNYNFWENNRKQWEKMAESRNECLFALGAAGEQLAKSTDAFNWRRPDADDIKEIEAIRRKENPSPDPINVDIGGVNRWNRKLPRVINLNIQPNYGQNVPVENFVWGDGAKLPFAARSVKMIWIEAAPVDKKWAAEAFRVIDFGGTISLYTNPGEGEKVYTRSFIEGWKTTKLTLGNPVFKKTGDDLGIGGVRILISVLPKVDQLDP